MNCKVTRRSLFRAITGQFEDSEELWIEGVECLQMLQSGFWLLAFSKDTVKKGV